MPHDPEKQARQRAYQKAWREKHRERLQQLDREKYLRTREERLASANAVYARDAELIKARKKIKYWSDPVKARAKNCTDVVRRRKNAARLAWSRANPERAKAINSACHLRRYHGITVAQYQQMLTEQKGVCAICLEPPHGTKHCGKLHVDHDHATGLIRALLCADCNKGIGIFRDDPSRLTKAAWYLERHRHAQRGQSA